MAQQTLQGDAILKSLAPAQAKQMIMNPVEIKGGQVKSITLTVPLLSGPNDYLVARLPDLAVQGLLSQVQSLPEVQRGSFVKDWIMKNQRAVLERYFKSKENTFRYDVVPVRTQPGFARTTPKKTEETATPPISKTVPKKEERTPVVPVSPFENEGKQNAHPGPKVSPVEKPELPKEIKGGDGKSEKNAFQIYYTDKQADKINKNEEIIIPITFSFQATNWEKTRFFKFNFRISQLTKKNRDATREEAWVIAQHAFVVLMEELGPIGVKELGDMRSQFRIGYRNSINSAASKNPEIADYFNKN